MALYSGQLATKPENGATEYIVCAMPEFSASKFILLTAAMKMVAVTTRHITKVLKSRCQERLLWSSMCSSKGWPNSCIALPSLAFSRNTRQVIDGSANITDCPVLQHHLGPLSAGGQMNDFHDNSLSVLIWSGPKLLNNN